MISYQVYKIVHLSGIALILLGLGAVLGAFANSQSISGRFKVIGFATHGAGLLLALVGGFGMAARLGMVSGLPGWIYGKLAVWFLLGLGISLAKRKSQWSLPLMIGFTALVGIATGLAVYKP